MGKYKVIVSRKANEMMKEHILFLSQTDKNSAIRMKDNLIESIKSLEIMPKRYSFFNEEYIPCNKYHKMYVQKWYIVLYQNIDDTVFVDYVLDCRKDYQWLV